MDVTAQYSKRIDGGVKVINRGYDQLNQEWKEIEGKAFFQDTTDKGLLKVSFFGPFYGTYNIIALDKINYSYALVCGPNKSYLWILARTPEISKKITDDLFVKAYSLGFDTSKLIFVEHSRK
ncbi:lipocalin family protein [Leptospira limi]|uniref:Lipocalin family protein n=1 Tax=Leptospira limi TaxID=2950023 RepID=A0ABT3LSJ9_9LEPT|nr:lipocalin family protein [Leptospira limi]MCW7460674.1 lipocalin family protein [Leptospira limi]